MFKQVNSSQNLSELEEQTLDFWQKNRIFEKSIENRPEEKSYSFYDGPPFATGTPHYGHIVASVIKDVVPRFWTMKGCRVSRRWGWDCHGLPIENIAEEVLGIKHKKEIEKLGIEKFNNVCRQKVLEYVSEWEKIIPRLGRWVDMKNAYRTMDLKYMESVWWVFKELWDKGLIYEGYRSMHICPRCETTLSQSEVSEGYKTIKDLSVVVKFAITSEPNTYLLSWTTTPWTLIGNVALAVGESIDYVKIKVKDECYILAKKRLEIIKDNYQIIDTFKGAKLVGRSYKPIFDYYKNIENHEKGWKVYAAKFVNIQEGTGVVHIAPAFGEDDLNLAKAEKLPFIQHIGMDGIVKPEVVDFAGLSVKPIEDVQKTDVEIIKYLSCKNLLFSKEQYEHSYPHCWRCETPLLNYATSSYFVSVEKLKAEAMKLAQDINWSPKHLKIGRFGKWLEGARDWSISRQRYWASVIPIWRCDKCLEIKVIGSVKELEDLSGQKINDIHKDKIDPVTFACDKCDGKMQRIPDVLDTWFDSGSMPYAQTHYPFENKIEFQSSFPAEFIGEGQDQTRAWFYYLHIMAVALKGSVAFRNAVVNGIVLAEDGKKMSKRLKNYPDPEGVINKYGADTLRLYLLASPVMQAENLNFSEHDLAQMQRGFFRMLWNSYSFFTIYANADGWQPDVIARSEATKQSLNILDRWILSELNTLIKNVNQYMENYELTKATRVLLVFVDNLSNWYIRRSRKRFRITGSYQTLWTVLVELSKTLAPFAPFMAEEMYQNLTGKESVHLVDFPKANTQMIDSELSEKMLATRRIVELGLAARAELGNDYRIRQPLNSLKYGQPFKNIGTEHEIIIQEEVNIKKIIFDDKFQGAELDNIITPQLKQEGLKNDLIRLIQDLRKKSGLKPQDEVNLNYTKDPNLDKIIAHFKSEIETNTKTKLTVVGLDTDKLNECVLAGEKIYLGINKK